MMDSNFANTLDRSYVTVSEYDDSGRKANHRRSKYNSFEEEKMESKHKSFRRSNKPMQKQNESIIEWFDRSVEDELSKIRYDPLTSPLKIPKTAGTSHVLITDSSVSGIEIQADLSGRMETELTDAVNKFARAEAAISFKGAVRAAEKAAAQAPPELAEEAAVLGAKGFQAELTNIVHERFGGIHPIEVIGYVGITSPKFPKRSQK